MTDTLPMNSPHSGAQNQADVPHPGHAIDPTTHYLVREALSGIGGSIARQGILLKHLVESPVASRLELDRVLEPLFLELVRVGRGLQDVALAIPRFAGAGQSLPPENRADALRACRDVLDDAAQAGRFLGTVLDACEGGLPAEEMLTDAAAWAARLHSRLALALDKAREVYQGPVLRQHPAVH
jgi:hypothetical protein